MSERPAPLTDKEIERFCNALRKGRAVSIRTAGGITINTGYVVTELHRRIKQLERRGNQ